MHSTPQSAYVACGYPNRAQDAQKGRPARPQRAKTRIVLVPYGERLNDARTPLADFFRILLGPLVIFSPFSDARMTPSEGLAGVMPNQQVMQDGWILSSTNCSF